MYQATVQISEENKTYMYFEITGGTFKQRFNKQKKNPARMKNTEKKQNYQNTSRT